jgi:hypothetical protein
MLHYKGGMSVKGKKTISKNMGHTEFSVQGDMCRIRTLRKIPPWVRVSERKGKNTARLAPTECSKILATTKWSRH